MRKQKQSKITTFAILTTVTVLTWVFVEAYLIINKTSLKNIPPEVLREIDPTLNVETLTEIERRRYFADTEVPVVQIETIEPAAQTEIQE